MAVLVADVLIGKTSRLTGLDCWLVNWMDKRLVAGWVGWMVGGVII